jgi:hypothetical protein
MARAIPAAVFAGCAPAGLSAFGCAALTCEPAMVLVARKEERPRLEMVHRGFRTNAVGRLEEIRTLEVVREYWVRADDGTWHRVSLEQFQGAEPGAPVEVCR